ncbi:WbqC family protein [Poritiphilus flavus]|uniref:WbqC-like protein family protein n=1 Tax=Poritiphilus flavus TaxID=2697053 RepID=A0A6L9EAB3_9FLAO|nr:WbqC family protein [Poritiphilus flavus]NAS11399.1 hypothetical protein [Poritiphilus flavus]
MQVLLHPVYFPSVFTFGVILKQKLIWEVWDNYQKQTYRNRCYIATDQGRHLLSIPIKHVGGEQGRQLTKDVRLENAYSWQRQHWRTLQTAYRTSPFFEFYEDDLAPLYHQEYTYLLDFNLKTIETICECIGMDMPFEKSVGYVAEPDDVQDGRFLVNAKKEIAFEQQEYIQVFSDRHGFVKNLSILDLLFNEGTSSLDYLENLTIDLNNA